MLHITTLEQSIVSASWSLPCFRFAEVFVKFHVVCPCKIVIIKIYCFLAHVQFARYEVSSISTRNNDSAIYNNNKNRNNNNDNNNHNGYSHYYHH